MYCHNCGVLLNDSSKFCVSCGVSVNSVQQNAAQNNNSAHNNNPVQNNSTTKEKNTHLIGFSNRINDPAFSRYLKNTNNWSAMFSLILALIAIIGFFVYGEASSEMDNPQAILIGCGIGGMFVLIAILQIVGRGRSTTWDGTVIDKRIEKKRRKRYNTGNDYYWESYNVFIVVIKSDEGKNKEIRNEEDDTVYNYYQIGERVRHHKGLNTLEKYDKSKDSIIFCNACASLNEIENDFCFRCKCPLLK